jgi:hypothetical protein
MSAGLYPRIFSVEGLSYFIFPLTSNIVIISEAFSSNECSLVFADSTS